MSDNRGSWRVFKNGKNVGNYEGGWNPKLQPQASGAHAFIKKYKFDL